MAEFGLAEAIMLLLFLITAFIGGGTTEGNVQEIIDGDTVDLKINNTTERVRLLGIDAPETSSAYIDGSYEVKLSEDCHLEYGDFAEKKLENKLDNKTVRLQYDAKAGTKGYYNRTLAELIIKSTGENVNEWMVRNGYAVGTTEKYEYTYSTDQRYIEAEKHAKENNLGVWQGCSGEIPS